MPKKKVHKKDLLDKKDKKTIGAPEKEINWKAINEVLEYGLRMPSVINVSGVLSRQTITDKIKEKFNMDFSEYREIQMSKKEGILLGRMWDLTASNDETVSLKAITFLLTHVHNYSQKLQVNQVTASVSYEEYIASLEKNS